MQNGVDQVFLDDISKWRFHIVIDVNIVAEQVFGGLELLIVLIADFVLINDYVVHFDNRAVFPALLK